MAGHILRDSFKPVDYKEGERSNLVLSEFHHIVDAAFFIYSSMIFYFSGTGNSKWIANQLSKEQQEDLCFIPDAWKNDTWEFSLREDEKIGFVFPVYSWAPPVIVQEFIRKLVLKGYQQQYLFFVCSCGDDTGLTRQVMEKALAARGWRCNAGFSVIMPNNYVLFPGFDVDSKELEKKKLAEAVPALEKVSRLITGRETVFACKEGSLPFYQDEDHQSVICSLSDVSQTFPCNE
ncbi:EFR1 family ferrodoxin [Bacteroides thetaiotaomicron]|nr:EFR1 family ferrodoxin [Bacteroides thetaiotaomicron]